MSTMQVIIGLALGVLLAIFIVVFRRRHRDIFAVLLVAGVVAMGVAVTVYEVEKYREEKATAADSAEPAAPSTYAGLPAGPPPKPPVAIPMRPPLIGGPSGSAAPPAVENPYAGGTR